MTSNDTCYNLYADHHRAIAATALYTMLVLLILIVNLPALAQQ